MCNFAKELGISDSNDWEEKALKRKETMINLMQNETGLLLDYDFVNETHSKVLSSASFYPLFAGLADEKNVISLISNLHRLETEYGVLSTEKNELKGNYQWGYPNGWACLQYIAVMGLDKYGYKAEAKRIAQNYIKLVGEEFERTSNLWEKYNVIEGNVNVTNETNRMPAMMGWTAGVYLSALKYLQ